jgi:hypothetical protein
LNMCVSDKTEKLFERVKLPTRERSRVHGCGAAGSRTLPAGTAVFAPAGWHHDRCKNRVDKIVGGRNRMSRRKTRLSGWEGKGCTAEERLRGVPGRMHRYAKRCRHQNRCSKSPPGWPTDVPGEGAR